MKKVLLIAAVAGLAMASCKKDHTCECTSSSTFPGSTSTTQKYTIKEASKKTAKDVCVKRTYDMTFGGTTYVTTQDCQLK